MIKSKDKCSNCGSKDASDYWDYPDGTMLCDKCEKKISSEWEKEHSENKNMSKTENLNEKAKSTKGFGASKKVHSKKVDWSGEKKFMTYLLAYIFVTCVLGLFFAELSKISEGLGFLGSYSQLFIILSFMGFCYSVFAIPYYIGKARIKTENKAYAIFIIILSFLFYGILFGYLFYVVGKQKAERELNEN